MAEEKKEQAVEEAAKPKKSPILLISIIGMLMLFSAGGFFAWKYFLQISNKGEAEKKAKKEDKLGPIYPLETFIVNLADKDSQKYLKLTIQLEIDQPKLIQELNMRKPQLRDIIIGLLSMQVYNDVVTYKGKAFIRKEIINRINNILLSGAIKRVFFTEFVLQ